MEDRKQFYELFVKWRDKIRRVICAGLGSGGTDFSAFDCDTINPDDLNAFDGNSKPDKIIKITVDYNRITKIKLDKKPDGAKWDELTWDYKEQLTVDRESESIVYVQYIGTGCTVTRKYQVEEGISNLLDNLDVNSIFGSIAGNPTDAIDYPNETKDYTITVTFMRKPPIVIKGSFDRNGLPEDWPEFINTIHYFLQFYGMGELFNPSIYGKAKRRTNEYMFCSVEFSEGGKSYYYISDDDAIEVGDLVMVPVGNGEQSLRVEVIQIDYFTEENAPFPIEKAKHIIAKA